MTTDTSAVKAAVDQVLKSAGLPMTDEDYERLLRVYPLLRQMADQLRIPEARYAEPAIVYPAMVAQ